MLNGIVAYCTDIGNLTSEHHYIISMEEFQGMMRKTSSLDAQCTIAPCTKVNYLNDGAVTKNSQIGKLALIIVLLNLSDDIQ
jgi:hypothetical protein